MTVKATSPASPPDAARSIFGEADHSPFSGSGVELIYGRHEDGSLVHISAVPSGLACQCVCPACGRRLVARKGPKTADHFAHYGAGAGCGRAVETNAHIWAKAVLERTKRILLPAIEAEEAGRLEVARPASMFRFDEVRLEKRFGDLVPDVIVRAGSRELLVEVYVTHRCDETKITKIRAGGVSAMEVDLSALRTCQDPRQVGTALLRAAPRAWLYNPFVDEAARKLKAAIAKEKADAAAALRRQAAKMIALARRTPAGSVDRMVQERAQLARLGCEGYLLWASPSVDGFTVAAEHWQAALYVRCVIGFAARPAWSRRAFDAFDVIEKLGDCVAPSFAKRLGRGLLEALHDADFDFVPPSTTIARYLDWLTDAGVLTHDGFGYQVSHAEAQDLARLRQRHDVAAARRRRVTDRVNAILNQLPDDETAGFDLGRWMRSPLPVFSSSVEALIEADDQAWWTFEARLDRIESMQAGWSWTEEFLNLPLKGELERATSREQARQAAAADRKRQELETAANGRVLVATARAETVLGADAAAAWLERAGRSSATSPLDAARASPEGLAKVLRALDRIEAERRVQLAREAAQAAAQGELRRAAAKVFDEVRAEVFLRSAHPALNGRSPLAYCADPVTLRACVALLPARRRG
jgi:hypothetical protein